MTHAPKFWAAKLPADQQLVFWNLVVEWNYSGESAYHAVLAGAVAFRRS